MFGVSGIFAYICSTNEKRHEELKNCLTGLTGSAGKIFMGWMFIFMVLPLLGIAYVSWHVWVLLPLANIWRALVVAVIIGAFVLLFLNMGRRFDGFSLPVARILYEIGTSSVFILLYLTITFLVLDLGRLLRIVPRSLLFANGPTALTITVLLTAVFVYGNWNYRHKVRVPLELATDKPLARDYKLVMATDLHLGYHNPRRELARWVDMINAEKPDLILIAGDIIDGSMRPLTEERMAEEFHRLTAPVYACLGNHEYFSGEPAARQFYRDAGIHLLIDEAAVIDSCLVIIGRDDRMNRQRKTVAALTDHQQRTMDHSAISTQPSPFTIILDHQPYHLEQTEQAGVDFQLSGHTHRGQLWPVSWITDAVYECSWGSHQRGATRYYVSSGLGIWGGKFRIGTQSEYVVATIKKTIGARKD